MSTSTETVVAGVQAYADRGIFRGYGWKIERGGRVELRFLWHADEPHALIWNPKTDTLTFRDLLPNIPHRSVMDTELRRFLRARASAELPAHRRIDPTRATVRAVNRMGRISVELKVKSGDLAYGLRKLVNLVNEIFFSFLTGPYEAYMVENFGVPEE